MRLTQRQREAVPAAGGEEHLPCSFGARSSLWPCGDDKSRAWLQRSLCPREQMMCHGSTAGGEAVMSSPCACWVLSRGCCCLIFWAWAPSSGRSWLGARLARLSAGRHLGPGLGVCPWGPLCAKPAAPSAWRWAEVKAVAASVCFHYLYVKRWISWTGLYRWSTSLLYHLQFRKIIWDRS